MFATSLVGVLSGLRHYLLLDIHELAGRSRRFRRSGSGVFLSSERTCDLANAFLIGKILLDLGALVKLFLSSVCCSFILVGDSSHAGVSAILTMLLHLEVSAFFFEPYVSVTLRHFSATILPVFPFFIFLCYPVGHRREAALFPALSLLFNHLLLS